MDLSRIIIIIVTSMLLHGPVAGSTVSNRLGNASMEALSQYIERVSDETGCSPRLTEIEDLLAAPVYLRYCTVAELLQVPGLTTSEARAIVKAVQIDSVFDYNILASRTSLVNDKLAILLVCTNIDEIPDRTDYTMFRCRTRHRLCPVYGLENANFRGGPLDLYSRLTSKHKNISLSVLGDKDLGERLDYGFASASVEYADSNYKLIAGDYYIELGMGSLLWKSFDMGKGSDVISSVLPDGKGIKQYRSSMEYDFFRGGACQSEFNIASDISLRPVLWYSDRLLAATKDSSGITSVYNSGYFRTETEMKKPEALREQNIGASLSLDFGNNKLAISAMYLKYGSSLATQSSSVFRGREGLLASLNYRFNNNWLDIATEYSRDARGHSALKCGAACYWPTVKYVILARSYSEKFRTPYGYNFGEFSYMANEAGLYNGLEFRLDRRSELGLYVDLFRTWGPTYYVDDMVSGIDVFSQYSLDMQDGSNYKLKLTYENKTDQDDSLFFRSEKLRLRLRSYGEILDVNYMLSLDGSALMGNTDNEYGAGLSLALSSELSDGLILRWKGAAFSTDSYYTAIYGMRSYVPGVWRLLAQYGSGIYSDIVLDWRLGNFRGYLMYNIIYKNDVEAIGSTLSRTERNYDHNIIFQLDIIF